MLAQSYLHDFVVYMCFVCLEHLFAVQFPLQGYTNDINAGDEDLVMLTVVVDR